MPLPLQIAFKWLGAYGDLIFPMVLVLWMAWADLRTRRVPNYLTFGGALAGLAFHLGFQGWPGLMDSTLGMLLGFALLFGFYLMGGMGAGDVKALAALGAWLGPRQTFHLFVYMGLSGGVLILGLLWWRGTLWHKLSQIWATLVNKISPPPPPADGPDTLPGSAQTVEAVPSEGMPYALALAMGMALLFCRGM